jgi:hypothetical protein
VQRGVLHHEAGSAVARGPDPGAHDEPVMMSAERTDLNATSRHDTQLTDDTATQITTDDNETPERNRPPQSSRQR